MFTVIWNNWRRDLEMEKNHCVFKDYFAVEEHFVCFYACVFS